MLVLKDYRIVCNDSILDKIIYLIEDSKWGKYHRVVKLLRLLRSPRELSQIERKYGQDFKVGNKKYLLLGSAANSSEV